MSVAKVALPSSVVVSFAPSSPRTLSCAFRTATDDCPWIEVPLGSALKVVSPGVASDQVGPDRRIAFVNAGIGASSGAAAGSAIGDLE
jgi:hypothetical protein